MNENSKTNLLIDSLSDDSEDVPDLQLIPPVKAKKKKLRKVTGPKWPNRSKLEEETSESFAMNEGRRPTRLWSVSLAFTLISLVIGLILCSWFCIRLYKEVEHLKEILNASSIEYKEKIKNIEEKLAFILSQPDRTRPNNFVGAPNISSMPQNAMQNDYKNVLTELEFVKQNITRLNDVTKEHYLDLADNKIIQDLQSNVTQMLENCTKSCSPPPSLMNVKSNVPTMPGPPGTTDIPHETQSEKSRP